ncbi:SGNH/GDSL hydrolase family protein [Nocardia sp. NPDC051570]|uniref:SGNH/GDSL hydrolase family protein n=1 Tax=Nocardia sp. NPDC051570 TaxID=3364324 RepID=UPI0037A61F46
MRRSGLTTYRKLGIKAWIVVMAASAFTATVATPAGAAPPAGGIYVALGSSFAAGPGIPPQQPGSPPACGRSQANYATLVARHYGMGLHDVSCQGAIAADILTTSQHGQPPQIEAVGPDTDLVTITIGGNDVDYLGSLLAYSCHNSNGRDCKTVDQSNIDRALRNVALWIGHVVEAVLQRTTHAVVLLVNYLTVLPQVGPPCGGVPLTNDELSFEWSVANRLEAATSEAAKHRGAYVVHAAAESRGHDACSSDPWVEQYRPRPGRTPYHPNETGMTKVADLIEATLAKIPG